MIERNFFETIVAGENPASIIQPYNKNILLEKPVIVYKFEDAEFLRAKHIEFYNGLIYSGKFTDDEIENLKETRDEIMHVSAEDFFYDLACEYDIDDDGNAVTNKNLNGKYSFYQNGKLFSVPFITLDRREVFQARKKDIDWSKMHLNGKKVYENAWDMVMGKKKPKTDEEKIIYENMRNRVEYFRLFKTKDNYVMQSTAFWAYAFVDENKWVELDETTSQFEWVKNFYDRFIKPLDDNTLLTIFECKK